MRLRTDPLGIPLVVAKPRVPTGEFDASEISGVEDIPVEYRPALQSMGRKIQARAHADEANALLDFASRLGSLEARIDAVDDGGGMAERIAGNTSALTTLRTTMIGEKGDNGKIGTLTARVTKFESVATKVLAAVFALAVGAVGTAWTVNRRSGEVAGESKAALDAERARFVRIEHELEILRAEIRAVNQQKGSGL